MILNYGAGSYYILKVIIHRRRNTFSKKETSTKLSKKSQKFQELHFWMKMDIGKKEKTTLFKMLGFRGTINLEIIIKMSLYDIKLPRWLISYPESNYSSTTKHIFEKKNLQQN